MRFIGGLILLLLAILAFHWCAGEIAIQNLGSETRARVTRVTRSFSMRVRSSYSAHYEFDAREQGTAYGTFPSHRGAEGSGVTIRYLRHDPSWNTPKASWYAGLWMAFYGALAWPLALWSARTFLFRRIHRLGEPEDEEEDDTETDGTSEKTSPAEAQAAPAPAPVADLGPVPFRNRWPAAFLFSLALSAVAIACNLVWFKAREEAYIRSASAALPPPPALDGDALPPPPPLDAPTPTPPVAPLPRGASLGNTANGSLLGFDGDAFYYGLWRNYDNPAAPPPGLYRFSLDGTGRTLVGKPGETEGIYRGIQVKDEWIYYIAMNGIRRIRKDGTKQKQLTENRVASIAVVGDWIYYQHSALNGAIYRMRLDGSREQRLCREAVGALCVADDGWIYYANQSDQAHLWRMKHDGTERTRLTDRRVGLLLVQADVIWFTDLDKHSSLCLMSPAGTGVEVVVEDQVSTINWHDGRIYFNRNNGELARCKADGTELETVAPLASSVLIHAERLFIHPDIEAKSFKQSKLDGSSPRDLRF